MNSNPTLSDAIDSYLEHHRIAYSKATTRGTEQALRKFLTVVGNIQMRSLGPEHGERFQSWLVHKGYAANSINTYISGVSRFSTWAAARRMLRPGSGPMATTRYARVVPKARLRIPATDFPRVLDVAFRADVRMMLALGFYLFLRHSDMTGIRVGDVSLSEGEVRLVIRKTSGYDVMPICSELDAEIRRWYIVYQADLGRPLRREDFLIPAHLRVPTWVVRETGLYNPTRPVHNSSRLIQRSLERAGYAVADEHGKTTREGMHTLRRSGARAYYEELLRNGGQRDDILRQVMAMLHHSSVSITEHYLGLEADREKRDLRLKGKPMFAPIQGVVSIAREA